MMKDSWNSVEQMLAFGNHDCVPVSISRML